MFYFEVNTQTPPLEGNNYRTRSSEVLSKEILPRRQRHCIFLFNLFPPCNLVIMGQHRVWLIIGRRLYFLFSSTVGV